MSPVSADIDWDDARGGRPPRDAPGARKLRSVEEWRRELATTAAASRTPLGTARARVERVLRALLSERYPDVVAQLRLAGLAVTWDGVTAAVAHFARPGGDATTAAALDDALFTAFVAAFHAESG